MNSGVSPDPRQSSTDYTVKVPPDQLRDGPLSAAIAGSINTGSPVNEQPFLMLCNRRLIGIDGWFILINAEPEVGSVGATAVRTTGAVTVESVLITKGEPQPKFETRRLNPRHLRIHLGCVFERAAHKQVEIVSVASPKGLLLQPLYMRQTAGRGEHAPVSAPLTVRR